ncbi:hypothetical protein C8R45DRAFT_1005416 [Mycena sanguinolenta]|nr:hypothetical protein C8R45DRAFT_1005416 [Mycena sanguinolenta]
MHHHPLPPRSLFLALILSREVYTQFCTIQGLTGVLGFLSSPFQVPPTPSRFILPFFHSQSFSVPSIVSSKAPLTQTLGQFFCGETYFSSSMACGHSSGHPPAEHRFEPCVWVLASNLQ